MDDEVYGLNSPLRSIYDRSSRTIYSSNLHNNTNNNRERESPPTTTAYAPPPSPDYTRVLEKHLRALRDIDQRLAALGTTVELQGRQLERMQQDMYVKERETQHEKERERRFYSIREAERRREIDTQTNQAERQRRTEAEGNRAQRQTEGPSVALLVLGAAVVFLLFVIVFLLVARLKKDQEAEKTKKLEHHVKQAVYDVLSQSRSFGGGGIGGSNRGEGTLTGSRSYLPPLAFGP